LAFKAELKMLPAALVAPDEVVEGFGDQDRVILDEQAMSGDDDVLADFAGGIAS
jgi:hypothetical protein